MLWSTTVWGFGSSILEMSVFWLSVNHSGNVYSALNIFAMTILSDISTFYLLKFGNIYQSGSLPSYTNSSGFDRQMEVVRQAFQRGLLRMTKHLQPLPRTPYLQEAVHQIMKHQHMGWKGLWVCAFYSKRPSFTLYFPGLFFVLSNKNLIAKIT